VFFIWTKVSTQEVLNHNNHNNNNNDSYSDQVKNLNLEGQQNTWELKCSLFRKTSRFVIFFRFKRFTLFKKVRKRKLSRAPSDSRKKLQSFHLAHERRLHRETNASVKIHGNVKRFASSRPLNYIVNRQSYKSLFPHVKQCRGFNSLLLLVSWLVTTIANNNLLPNILYFNHKKLSGNCWLTEHQYCTFFALFSLISQLYDSRAILWLDETKTAVYNLLIWKQKFWKESPYLTLSPHSARTFVNSMYLCNNNSS